MKIKRIIIKAMLFSVYIAVSGQGGFRWEGEAWKHPKLPKPASDEIQMWKI